MVLLPHPYSHTLCPALSRPDASPADAADRLERVPQLFLDALFVAFQSEKGRVGFAEDLRWCAGLCTATWREETLWNGLVHVRRGRTQRTHLMYAAQRGDVARVRWLLARGAPAALADRHQRTALFRAASEGHLDVVRLLVASGANVNAELAVYAASRYGHVDVVRALLAAEGVDVNAAGRSGSAVRAAGNNNYVEVVRVLLAAGALVAIPWFESRIHFACKYEDAGVVRRLLAEGGDVNKLYRGYYPIHAASEHGCVDVVRALLSAGADPNVLVENADDLGSGFASNHYAEGPNYGLSALAIARRKGRADIVDALICGGADAV